MVSLEAIRHDLRSEASRLNCQPEDLAVAMSMTTYRKLIQANPDMFTPEQVDDAASALTDEQWQMRLYTHVPARLYGATFLFDADLPHGIIRYTTLHLAQQRRKADYTMSLKDV